MKLTLHEDHVRLVKELQEQQKKETDILSRYTPADLKSFLHVDLYFLLNVQEYRRKKLPQNILFQRYRERIARYHPNYHDDRIFMGLQDGYEILKSTFWKKKYDEYFVEEIAVADKAYTSDFFDFFGRYFDSMSVFAKREAPALGDRDTPVQRVKEFYVFWRNFESVRNFDFIAYSRQYESMGESERTEYDYKYKKLKQTLFNQHVLDVRQSARVAERNDPRIERAKVDVNPALVCKGWAENDIIALKRLTRKFKTGNGIDWKKVVRDFRMENGTKKSMKDLLVKNTQIEKLCK